MVKKELIETPILGKILLRCGAFPVDRSKGDIGAIKTAIEALNQKKVLSLFPEGTRHRDGKFRDIKKGAALIAIKTNSMIVPARIIGNYKLFSKMILRIGEPISPEGLNKDELTEKLREAIDGLANKEPVAVAN
jgi:1-acyl-sn-glycerol-3-phosphate acyltransferase